MKALRLRSVHALVFRDRNPGARASFSFDLKMLRRLLAGAILLVGLTPSLSWACACGCGVFDVGTPSLIPNGSGGTVWFETDFMNQYINWHDSGPSAWANNADKQIKTEFLTVGGQYMFNRNWGAMMTVPYTIRTFRTAPNTTSTGQANFPTPQDQIDQFRHSNFGDVRIWGMYTGLQEDMSLGLLGGFKLPTGDHTYENFDRDTSIGTGSTDLLLAAYKIGTFPTHIGNVNLTFLGRPFQYYLQGQFEYPFTSTGNYEPGKENDNAVGIFYNFGALGSLGKELPAIKEVAPFLTLLSSFRAQDKGSEATPTDSGYDRLLLAPGGEVRLGILRFYADMEFPIYQHVNGQQLTAPYLIKTIVSYDF
jgi:hypothetical protein